MIFAQEQKQGEVYKMMKKASTIILLSVALLFGGVFQTSVDASASADQSHSYSKPVYYSSNGNWNSGSWNKVNNHFSKYFSNWYKMWNSNYDPKADQSKKESNEVEKKEEKTEQPKQEQEAPKQEKPAEQVPNERPAPAPNKEEQSQSQLPQLNEYEQQVFDLTNNERTKQGLAPFKVDLELSRVAREKSRDMAGSGYFAHNSPTYGSPFDMMKSYGITYRTAGENIAKGQRTPSEVVNAWMNSPGHRANILNGNFTHIGVGYVEQGNSTLR